MSEITVRIRERLSDRELLIDSYAWGQGLHVGDTVRLELGDECTFGEVAIGPNDRPLLVTRHVLPRLGRLNYLRFYRVRAGEPAGALA